MGGSEELSQALYDSLLEPVAEGCDLIAGVTHDIIIDIVAENGRSDLYASSDNKAGLMIYRDLGLECAGCLGLINQLEDVINHAIYYPELLKDNTLLDIMRSAYLTKYHP